MITIEGKAKHEGVAIAVVAKVDSVSGINGVDPAILEEGIRSIKKGLTRTDYPEVVIACDNVVMGMSMKLPGVSTIGIAAQADMDVPGLEVDMPCVIGLANLLESIEQGSLMIVDGNRGVVHIDPDPHTLVRYQHIEDDRTSRSKLYISSEHIPARIQSGETVYVYAYIKNEGEVEQALDEGADGLVVDLRGVEADSAEFYRALMRAAPGKPLVFVVDFDCRALIDATSGYAAPGQVTVAFPPAAFDDLVVGVSEKLASEPDAQINIGCVTKDSESYQCDMSLHRLVVDMRKSALLKQSDVNDLTFRLSGWIGERDAQSALLLIGKHVDAVPTLVQAGARSLVVSPEMVGTVKYAIRAIGTEE